LLSVQAGGAPLPYSLTSFYLQISNPPINEKISIHFPLPIYETSEEINGRKIEMMWKGDSLIAMNQMETTLPFFEDINITRRCLWIESLGKDALALASPLDGNGTPEAGQLSEESGISPTKDRRGKENGAVRFDGHSSRLRYSLPYFPFEDYTFMIWARIDEIVPADVSYHQIVSACNASSDDPLRITLVGNTLYAGLRHETTYLTSGHELEDGRWYQIAVVKKEDSFILYLDGVSIEQIVVPIQLESNSKEVGIGYNPHLQGSEYFAGLMDEFRFFARDLSAEEISDQYYQEIKSTMSSYTYYR